ncbi:MAG: hypothetical protein VX985_06415 [SAR324 cluster bacterium]|nr:hypothetical protein [SAR324 cluster bacterium]
MQNISESAKQRLLKLRCFDLLIAVVSMCCSSILVPTLVSAQKLSAKVIACNLTVQARYKCFIKERTDSLQTAKELSANRRSILDAKEKLRNELIESPKKQRKKINRQEIMQQVEYSRSRNISHKGERYSITYGYVFEPSP